MSVDASSALHDLIERIMAWPYGMPVRLMEQVLAIGDSAVPALAVAVANPQDDYEHDTLWPIVLLGELGHEGGVAALVEQIRRSESEPRAVPAVESLAKIGAPAVSALASVAESGDESQRLYAYAALGWIDEQPAYQILIRALRHDRALGDVLALALAAQGRTEAIPALYEAYTSCEPWQRAEFEAALRMLDREDRTYSLRKRDWRLRYRRRPELDDIVIPSWVDVLAVAHGRGNDPSRGPHLPLRPLQAILDEPERREPDETCENCGRPIELFTGLPACPETAVALAVFQLEMLDDARDDDLEDLFELLDEFEAEEGEYRERGMPRAPAARGRWHEDVDQLEWCRRTCEWLIGEGIETVDAAETRLLAEANRLADRFGDREGLLGPRRSPRGGAARAGRNDPCPCGSGLKYKRCCLGKS